MRPQIGLSLDPDTGNIEHFHPATLDRCAVQEPANRLENPGIALGSAESASGDRLATPRSPRSRRNRNPVKVQPAQRAWASFTK